MEGMFKMKNRHWLLLAVVAFAGLPPQAIAQLVFLGSAGNFAVLAGSTVTSTGPTVLNGDLGLWPGTAVTETPAMTVNGTRHINDAPASAAQGDLTLAYDDAAGRAVNSTVGTELGGTTLTPGVYDSAAGTFGITGTLKLDAGGDPNAVWIFQAGSTLTTASSSKVALSGGAQAANVFWQVGSSATLGGASTFAGSILALTSIDLGTGATVDGRLLARNGAVTLLDNTVTTPIPEPPGTFLLFAGLLGLVMGVRRFRRHFQDSAF